MEKPYKYFLIHKETKKSKPYIGYNGVPITKDLCEWVEKTNNIKELKQVYDLWIDTRYEGKMRLYKYIQLKNNKQLL